MLELQRACLALTLAVATACQQDEKNSREEEAAAAAQQAGAFPSVDAVCTQKREQVFSPYQNCSTDQDCVLHNLGEHCVPLTCYEAFNARTDFGALDRDVDRLAEAFAASGCCEHGVSVSCAGPPDLEAVCDPQLRRCRWQKSPPQVGAGSGAPNDTAVRDSSGADAGRSASVPACVARAHSGAWGLDEHARLAGADAVLAGLLGDRQGLLGARQ